MISCIRRGKLVQVKIDRDKAYFEDENGEITEIPADAELCKLNVINSNVLNIKQAHTLPFQHVNDI